jgi:hypothetical protein
MADEERHVPGLATHGPALGAHGPALGAHGPALADVVPSALAALGLPGVPDRLGLSRAFGPGVRRIAVLLVDGLGYHLLPLARPVAPVLADLADARLMELYSGFPSTTPTSLVSLGTGVASGAHGVLGFTLNVPGTDRVLDHVAWRGDPDPRTWQPVPTLFARATAAGVRVSVVSRPEYAGSGLTIAAYGDVDYVGAADPDALAEQMLAALRAGPGLVAGYHPSLDSAAHAHGIQSPRWMTAASDVDRLIDRLADGLPDDAALLVTADHGGLNVPDDRRIDIDADPRLLDGVRVIAGEPRVRYVHTHPGARGDVLDAWRSILGAAAEVVSRAEAVSAGWFGPVPHAHLARIGDVVAVCRDRYVLLATKHEHKQVGNLVAYHGAMTSEETAIPLIVHSGQSS